MAIDRPRSNSVVFAAPRPSSSSHQLTQNSPPFLPAQMTKQVRLHMKAVHLGFKRNRRNQHVGQSRLQIEGVKDRKDTQFYMGKRVAYVFKAPKGGKSAAASPASRYRFMWGRIIAPHGDNGIVRAKFRNNLPPHSIGKGVRVMLYPSNV